jgi:hypothetical protein
MSPKVRSALQVRRTSGIAAGEKGTRNPEPGKEPDPMKRPRPSLLVLTLGIALLTGYAAWGQPKPTPPAAACPTTCGPQACPAPVCMPAAPRCCVPSSPDNAKLVEELLAILKETKSADTFIVTVKALSDLGPDARTAVPAIIRGGDRLGLFTDIEKQAKEEDGSGLMIVDAIEEILRGPCAAAGCVPPSVVGVPAQAWTPVPFAGQYCPAPCYAPPVPPVPRPPEPARPASLTAPPAEDVKR